MLIAKQDILANWSNLFSTQDWVIVNSDDSHANRFIDPRVPIINVPQDPANPTKCAKPMFTKVHLIIQLVNVRTSEKVVIEFFEGNIRVFGHSYPNANNAYRTYGLYFLYDKRYMSLPKNYRPTVILIEPTIEDLRTADLLKQFLRASQPDKLCTQQKAQRGDQPFYHPDFAGMVVPELAAN